MKRPVSITLDEDSLIWLKGQAAAATQGNVSEVINRLIAHARADGNGHFASRSVAGTVDLPSDTAVEEASEYVRALFDRSLNRALTAPEPRAAKQRRRGQS